TGTTSPNPAVSAALTGTGTAPPVPGVPTNLNAFRGGFGGAITANLSWGAVQYASSYDVQWSTSSTFSPSTLITGATSGNNYTFNGGANGLASGTTVYFQVRAVNITGAGGWSATFSSTVR
ncbi:MAG: fibronectin type III domain-containing protein, partial [Proteobacteria bacterium]|nr:fibronectin type III domain-containing protein [Pseudomonadota bacterium]